MFGRTKEQSPSLFKDGASRLFYDQLQQNGNLSTAEIRELVSFEFGGKALAELPVRNQARRYYLKLKNDFPQKAKAMRSALANANMDDPAAISLILNQYVSGSIVCANGKTFHGGEEVK